MKRVVVVFFLLVLVGVVAFNRLDKTVGRTMTIGRGGTFSHAVWSPDGSHFAVLHNGQQTGTNIEVRSEAGEVVSRHRVSAIGSYPTWSERGLIYIDRDPADPDRRIVYQVTDQGVQPLWGSSRPVWFSSSRDGDRLLGVSAPSTTADAHLYAFDPDTGQSNVIWQERSVHLAEVSPSGRYVAIITYDDADFVLSLFDIEAKETRQLWVVQRPYGLNDPMWSPDETYVGVTYVGGSSQSGYYLVGLDDAIPRLMTRTHMSNPNWSPDGSAIIYNTAGMPGANELKIWHLPPGWKESLVPLVREK